MEEKEEFVRKEIKGLNAKQLLALLGSVIVIEFTWISKNDQTNNKIDTVIQQNIEFKAKQLKLSDQLDDLKTKVIILESQKK